MAANLKDTSDGALVEGGVAGVEGHVGFPCGTSRAESVRISPTVHFTFFSKQKYLLPFTPASGQRTDSQITRGQKYLPEVCQKPRMIASSRAPPHDEEKLVFEGILACMDIFSYPSNARASGSFIERPVLLFTSLSTVVMILRHSDFF